MAGARLERVIQTWSSLIFAISNGGLRAVEGLDFLIACRASGEPADIYQTHGTFGPV